MTNTFNKVLAVFLSVGSLVFLGLVVAHSSGGVNWQSELRAQDLAEYKFELSDGENPQWTVTGLGNRPIATVDGNKLPEAILKARQDLERQQQKELTEIGQKLPVVETQLQTIQQLKTVDLEAMKKREADVERYLAALNAQVLKLSDQLTKKVQDTTTARTDAANLRTDVYRLTNELEVLRTDRARLVELRRGLADELLRLQITNQSLKQRVDQLQNSN